MAVGLVEVVTDAGRRRRYDDEERLRLVEGAFAPGVTVADFARERGVDASLLYRWRRRMFGGRVRLPAFTSVRVSDEPPAAVQPEASAAASGVMDIEFSSGARVRISGQVDPAAISAAVAALRDRSR